MYEVYRDAETGNMFTMEGTVMWSVNARERTHSITHSVEGGTLTSNCDVIDWRWRCNADWMGLSVGDEGRAVKALGQV